MKMIRYILGALFLLLAAGADAQLNLYVDPHAFDSIANRPYQLNNGNAVNTPTVALFVTNQSGTQFSDSLYFGYTVMAGGRIDAYASDTTVASGIYYPVTHVTLPPQGGAVVGSLIFHFTSPVFVVGSSIVVIWPIVKGYSAQVDSVTILFDITAPDGIGATILSSEKVYMAGSELVIKDDQNDIGGIRIFSLTGQLVMSADIHGGTRIPLSQYADGIYTVETISSQGARKVYKVLKQ